jgi:hypothetical protein
MLLMVFLQEIGRFRMAEAVAVHLGTTRSVVIVLKAVAVKAFLSGKLLIVPTLPGVTPPWTLCVPCVTQSVTGCMPTRSVGTIMR